ncbi:PEP-CTERM motif protein [Janthinobacterium sp. HH107]|uniref:choice-of-anchor E domain-containing protein n=1 Tax=Janthinobacterium sp. HH107 TaxID=1537279 RepID=UPI000875160D|nr:choice-of-anchor E domain-containing protein [Janthinobacterium sp. HH107]OEZ98991.1 PEP-CTERM motif protein [Janthinobacterium sp. HH107]
MQKSLIALAAAAVLSLGAASSAQAATQTISFSADRALGATNWSDTLGLGKFDSNLGTLTSIKFHLEGAVQGSGRTESLDASASNVTLSLASLLTLYRPDNSTLLVANPLFTQTFALSAFDGSIDFAGTSGASTGLRSSTGSNGYTSASASDFALFSSAGGGLIYLGLNAIGSSMGSGAGNLLTQFQTSASGRVAVTYEYVSAVPEPETYVMLLTGLALAGVMARRRKPRT